MKQKKNEINVFFKNSIYYKSTNWMTAHKPLGTLKSLLLRNAEYSEYTIVKPNCAYVSLIQTLPTFIRDEIHKRLFAVPTWYFHRQPLLTLKPINTSSLSSWVDGYYYEQFLKGQFIKGRGLAWIHRQLRNERSEIPNVHTAADSQHVYSGRC